MNQVELARALVTRLVDQGVVDFVLCAGARNAPFVKVLSHARGIGVLPFFDERSAAFFALGRILSECRPVAVVTTSGTAVAELLPATVEAWHSGLPLVLLTADRPRSYRGSGAPQSIQQVGIFSSFVSRTWDYALNDELDFVLDQNQPSHINVCFDEPLLDGEVNDWCLEPIEFDRLSKERAFQEKGRHEGLVEHCGSGCLVDNQNREASVLEQFLTRVAHPLVVVGRLNRKDQLKVEKILAHWNCPLYLESLSGLRESPVLREFRLESGEGIFYSTWTKKYFDGIIRIGGIPTLRLWRELETSLRDWPVLSFSDQSFSGLSRIEDSPLSLQELDGLNLARQGEGLGDYGRELLSWDRRRSDQLKNLLNLHLHSEPSLISSLSRLIPEGSLVFLGNSLPIREWELAADYSSRGLQLYSNRGVNGIDGILSSFLGVAQAKRENWVILGDLSTLYDLNAPWALPMAKGLAWRFVVVNNFGGKIFHRMFGEPLFQNRHEISFEGFAELWQLDYYRWHAIPRSLPEMTRGALIELRPDQEASDAFWSEYKMLNEVMNCCS